MYNYELSLTKCGSLIKDGELVYLYNRPEYGDICYIDPLMQEGMILDNLYVEDGIPVSDNVLNRIPFMSTFGFEVIGTIMSKSAIIYKSEDEKAHYVGLDGSITDTVEIGFYCVDTQVEDDSEYIL